MNIIFRSEHSLLKGYVSTQESGLGLEKGKLVHPKPIHSCLREICDSKASYSGAVVPVGTDGRSKEASKRTPEVLFGGSAIIPMCRNF